jgi:pyridoxal phosphate enzyme, YggS family
MISEEYLKIKKEIPKEVILVVVSKGQTVDDILQCYEVGARDFGENRLEEFLEKKERLPKDIRWHMIGAVQSKKVPKIIGQFDLIHSVDSLELAKKIESKGVKTRILLQCNTSGESTKQGLNPDEWLQHYNQIKNLNNVFIEGLMTMAPLTNDLSIIHHCFKNLRKLRDELSKRGRALPHLSMGMSGDWRIALEEGSTLLRIGSSIFKSKNV